MKNDKLLLFNEESERLCFRKLTENDFADWLRFCEDENSLKYIRLTENESAVEKCKAWFERVFNRYENGLGGMNALVDKTGNQLVGQCGLLIHTVDEVKELEIGYSIMPEHRKKGYAIEAARKCKDYAFENNLTESLISIIHIDNKNSAKVALKNGMRLEKRTNYNNNPVNIYRITKAEWRDSLK